MSSSPPRTARLRRRPSRIVPAVVVAVVLVALGVGTAVAALSRLADGGWPGQVGRPASTVAALTWGSSAVLGSAAVLALLGLLLLLVGLSPGRRTTAPLDAGRGSDAVADTDFVISTRSLARIAATRADAVDGVDRVSASASARRVHLSVTTTSERADEIRRVVTDRVTEQLTATGVRPVPQVRATVTTKGI